MKNRNLPSQRAENLNPTREISRLQRGIDRVFEDFFFPLISAEDTELFQWGFRPAMDIEEKEDQFIAVLDLPGVPKDAVKIEVRDHNLVISGQRREEHKETSGGRQFTERAFGTFQRFLSLPTNVDVEQISADYQDGVLKIMIPKTEVAKPRLVKIGESKSVEAKGKKEQAA